MNFLIYLGTTGIICAVIGAALGDLGGRKNAKVGFLLGLLLGPLGLIVAAVIPAAVEGGAARLSNGVLPVVWWALGGCLLLLGIFVAFVALL